MPRMTGRLRGPFWLLLPLLALACGRAPLPAVAPGRPSLIKVAVTVDDLPWIGQVGPGDSLLGATGRLVQQFTSRGIPAVGFVNCRNIKPEQPLVAAWRTAGLELGNHGHSHLDLNKSDVELWLEDARQCHQILTQQLQPDRPVRFFRYPFLHQGPDAASRERAAQGLAGLGYRNAHVTIDNQDYKIAAFYGRAAARGDADELARLGQVYREHLLGAFDQFDQVAREAVGRPVAQVLLVHANLVAADQLGSVLDALRARGVIFVSLEEALSDPVYAEPDRYVGPMGISWLYRARPTLLAKWGPREDAWYAALDQSLRRR
jgi:peptidoglycan-N-acetylglucosamine deacetylase